MLIKPDDNCGIKYLTYKTILIPVIVINRTKKLIPVNPILSIAKYYDSTPTIFIAAFTLSKGESWDKLSDSELSRITAIKRQDGYGAVPNSIIYYTPKGLECYLRAWLNKPNQQDKPVDKAFIKFCEDNNLVDNRILKPEPALTPQQALTKFRTEHKYLDLNESLEGLDKIYEDFKNILDCMDEFKKTIPQFKGFLVAMQRDSTFTDEFIYTMQSFCNAFDELGTISKYIRQYADNGSTKYKIFVKELMEKAKALEQ